MKKILLLATLLLMGACRTTVQDRPVQVLIPVPQPCKTKEPEPVAPIKEKFDKQTRKNWDIKQKSAAVSKQGLDLRDYSDDLKVASAGCPEIKG